MLVLLLLWVEDEDEGTRRRMSRRVLNYSHICKVGKKCELGQRTNERIAWPDNTHKADKG